MTTTRTNQTTPFDESELLDALSSVTYDLVDYSVGNDYSGRGMFGATCFSVVVPPGSEVSVGVALAAAAAAHHDNEGNPVDVRETLDLITDLARAASTNSMGRNVVVYFPGWSLPEEG